MGETIGAKVRRLRRERALSQTELAIRLASVSGHPTVTRHDVSRWERGTRTPRGFWVRHLARVLGVDVVALVGGVGNTLPEWAPHSDVDAMTPALHVLDRADNGGGWADAAYVESVRTDVARLVDLDTRLGGDDVAPAAVRLFRSANARLARGKFRPEVETDLAAVAGEAASVAAWCAFDAARLDLARELTLEGIRASRAAGDRSMEVFGISALGLEDLELRRPASALRLATEAEEGLTGLTRVVFKVRRARALAQLGREREATRVLAAARAELSKGGRASDPNWTWWVDESELAWQEGRALGDLGRWNRAVDLLLRCYELRGDQRARAKYNDLAHLLDAMTMVDAWTEATWATSELLAWTTDIGSSRTTQVLHAAAKRILRSNTAPSSLVDAAAVLQARTR
jgi:transcriptional regulator with XRE-family HTH domain